LLAVQSAGNCICAVRSSVDVDIQPGSQITASCSLDSTITRGENWVSLVVLWSGGKFTIGNLSL